MFKLNYKNLFTRCSIAFLYLYYKENNALRLNKNGVI